VPYRPTKKIANKLWTFFQFVKKKLFTVNFPKHAYSFGVKFWNAAGAILLFSNYMSFCNINVIRCMARHLKHCCLLSTTACITFILSKAPLWVMTSIYSQAQSSIFITRSQAPPIPLIFSDLLKRQYHEIFYLWFFHQSTAPDKPPKIFFDFVSISRWYGQIKVDSALSNIALSHDSALYNIARSHDKILGQKTPRYAT
jgi:hypothetical protein